MTPLPPHGLLGLAPLIEIDMAESYDTAPFVSTAWLADRLDDPSVQVIDGSWYLPTQNRNAAQEFLDGHLPGAVFFDIDAIADASSGLPHMLLSSEAFGAAVGALGVSSDSTLAVYDGAGLFSAPRVWWMLRLFGARDVRLLDGGLPTWRAEGRPLRTGPAHPNPVTFRTRQATGDVADLAAVRDMLDFKAAQVVDARPAARFKGEAVEPRPGVRAGHMPGSSNLPFTEIVADGKLKPPAAIRQAFADAGVDLDQPIITSCGSGVSAAILTLALEMLGKRNVRLYDGSWTEYGSRPDLPIATGA